MSSLVSASTPARLAFASAASNLASFSCSTVPKSSREGTDAGVADGLCSGFFGGSGGTGLSVVGSGSLLGGLDSFAMLGLMCFGTLPMGGVGFPNLLWSILEGLVAIAGASLIEPAVHMPPDEDGRSHSMKMKGPPQ